MGQPTRSPNRTYLIRSILAATEAEPEQARATEPTATKRPESDIAELQQRYREVVGRDTGFSDQAYLRWKIRQAERGKVPVGPRQRTPRQDVTFKVLPLRLDADLVEKLDDAWKRQGLRSRMDLFRHALQSFFFNAGEVEVAAMLGGGETE